MDLLESKLVSIILLGLGTIFVGLIPACFARQNRQQWPLIQSSLLCFGGGVLLSTAVVHILPEVRSAVPEYAELVFCAGFFILYFIDEVVHYFYGDTHEDLASIFTNSGHSHAGGSPYHQPHQHHQTPPPNLNRRKSYGTLERDGLLSGRPPPYNPTFIKAKSENHLFLDDGPPSQLCHVGHQEPCHTTPTVNIGLLVALSMHALLEGLVVGLEAVPGKVLILLGAVASHKLVVGFVLGVELASNAANSFCRHFACIFVFTFGSVLGIGVGMVITTIPSDLVDVVIPILQGLAGGTLLYVTVSEILPRERARWHQQHNQKAAGVCQFVAVGLGFTVMTLMSKYLDFDH